MLLMLAFDVGVVFFGGICLCRFVEFAIVFLTCGQAWCTSVLSIFWGIRHLLFVGNVCCVSNMRSGLDCTTGRLCGVGKACGCGFVILDHLHVNMNIGCD